MKIITSCLVVAFASPGAAEDVNCCVQPYSYFDCTGSGHFASPGKLYTCVATTDLTGCMSCLRDGDYREDTCSTCCAIEADADCSNIESEWEFYASTLFFICLCCCFTALCGFTEVRRKKKGISFAEAWSVPQAMPILPSWPRRSVSASDVSGISHGHGHIDAEGHQWASLSDDVTGDDTKGYPVAGLVDDSGVAFGFVSSLPQSLMASVRSSLGRSSSPPPPVPQEPELTVWISRDNVGVLGTVETSRPQQDSGGGGGGSSSGASRVGGSSSNRHQRAVVVGNDLEEPLVLGGEGQVEGGGLGPRPRQHTLRTGVARSRPGSPPPNGQTTPAT